MTCSLPQGFLRQSVAFVSIAVAAQFATQVAQDQYALHSGR